MKELPNFQKSLYSYLNTQLICCTCNVYKLQSRAGAISIYRDILSDDTVS